MVMPRRGFVDSYRSARLAHLAGTAYPTALTTACVGLFTTFPKSDGTGAVEIAIAARPTMALSAPALNSVRQQWAQSNSGVVTFAVPATATPGLCIGWGVFGATTGGTAVYFDYLPPFPFAPGQTLTFAVGKLVIWEEGGQ